MVQLLYRAVQFASTRARCAEKLTIKNWLSLS